MPPRLRTVGGAAEGASSGWAGFLLGWLPAGVGVSPRGSLSEHSLLDAASTGGGAGTGG